MGVFFLTTTEKPSSLTDAQKELIQFWDTLWSPLPQYLCTYIFEGNSVNKIFRLLQETESQNNKKALSDFLQFSKIKKPALEKMEKYKES